MIQYLLHYRRWGSLVGISIALLIAYVNSADKNKVAWRTILLLLTMQCACILLMLTCPPIVSALHSIASLFSTIYGASGAGIAALFGSLGIPHAPTGFIFAFQVLPTIIFFSACMSLLSYTGCIGAFVYFIQRLIRPIAHIDGPEGACAIANSFLGQTDAPLLIKTYLPTMAREAVFIVMVSGMGTLSSALFGIYHGLGISMYHMIVANIAAIPATILVATLMEPTSPHKEHVELSPLGTYSGYLHAFSQGAMDGVQVVVGIGAMIIVYVSLLSLCDGLLSHTIARIMSIIEHHELYTPIRCIDIVGYCMKPFLWLMGFGGDDMTHGAALMGTKLIGNEMLAYIEMSRVTLSERSHVLLTYLLCSFANISSIGIQIGCLSALTKRPALIAALGARALLAATLANFITGYIVALSI